MAQGNEVSEATFMAALRAAQPAIQAIIAAQRRLAEQLGVAKRQLSGLEPDPTGVAAVATVAQPLVDAVLRCASEAEDCGGQESSLVQESE